MPSRRNFIMAMVEDRRDVIILTEESCLKCAEKKLACKILIYYTGSEGHYGRGRATLLTWTIDKDTARELCSYGLRIKEISCIC